MANPMDAKRRVQRKRKRRRSVPRFKTPVHRVLGVRARLNR